MRIALQIALMLPALLLACVAHAEHSVLEVITLRHRPADQMLPVLRPLVAPGGTVSGLNNQLVIRTTPANLEQLKAVLARIDTRLRRLMISVRQDGDLERRGGAASVSGSIGTGDGVVIDSTPGKAGSAGIAVRSGAARARVYSSEGQRAARISQRVQVVEGGRAYIRIGESTPVRTQQWIDTPYGPRPVESDAYRDTDHGFSVVPHVVGDEVMLELSAGSDALTSRTSGAASTQHVQTTVSGRLGEWIEVAGIGEEALRRDDEILASSRDARREARRVLLKVDEVE